MIMKGCNCKICRRSRRTSEPKENNMRLTCKLVPAVIVKTLADLEPGVAAETGQGIRWRDQNNFVLGLIGKYPIVMNCNSGDSVNPKASSYRVIKVLGKINMTFEDV